MGPRYMGFGEHAQMTDNVKVLRGGEGARFSHGCEELGEAADQGFWYGVLSVFTPLSCC